MSRPAISYPLHQTASGSGPDAFDDMSSRRSASTTSYDMPVTPGPPGQQLRDGGPTSRSNSSQSRGPTSTLDSFITRLLVVTKQLLQGLDQWSQGVLSEEDVSDIYVRLGNGFELCVAAFRRVGIPTTDLDSVPRDLREILERALAEEPSQDTLNIYLPDIRAIIFNLLSGLKHKQTAYKRLQADRQQHQPEFSPASAQGGAPPSRPPRLSGAGTPEGPGSPGSISSQITSSTARPPSSAALAERNSNSQHRDRRAPPPDAFRPTRSRPSGDSFSKPVPQDHLPNHTPSPPMQNTPPPQPTPSGYTPPLPPPVAGPSRPPSRPSRASRESFGHGHVTSRFSADSDASGENKLPTGAAGAGRPLTPIEQGMSPGSPTPTATVPAIHLPGDTPFPEPRPAQPPAPAPPMSPPSADTTMREVPDAPAPPRIITDDVPQTFARLQRTEALERRASKRFSSFTFNKMLPGSPNTKKPSASPQRPVRRDRAPPLPSLQEDSGNRRLSHVGSLHAVTSISSGASSPTMEQAAEGRPASIMGGLGIVVDGPDGSVVHVEQSESAETDPSPAPSAPKPMSVFLQLGRQVKKTTVELPLTQSALRLLFMERFEYDPGMEDFPDVYIRDNRTGVQYELEDMDDVKEGCVLTLDVEPLDQVKQHFDLTFAQLSQEIKELKSSLTLSRRMSTQGPSLLGVSSPSSLAVSPIAHVPVSPPMPRPVDRTPEQPMARPLPASARSVSAGSMPASNIDLQRHHKEVQDLRTDLAVLRQIHVDFLNGVKEQFTALRAENTAMREVVKTKMGGNRALLDNSKTKLDAQCQDTIQAVEEVSDIIDGAREDALRRGVTPSRTKMEKIKADLDKATALVETFSSDVTLAEPTWRATWLTELQRVTEEQRLLAYQNKLAADLKNDVKDAAEMLENVNAFVVQRQAAGGASGKKFRPPSPEEGAGGISHLLLEIRTKESDPNQRLRAIEEQQRARERELASQTDEFSNELAGFVQGKKLRKTGGTEEAERVRQRRHDQTVKRMLSGDIPGETPGIISPQATGNTNQG